MLHGHVPYYAGGHPDAVLDRALLHGGGGHLLAAAGDAVRLWAHFAGSIRHSSQALPVNALLDTLVRPNGDTAVGEPSCVEWRAEPRRAVPHVVLAAAGHAGGQWAARGPAGVGGIGALSYA